MENNNIPVKKRALSFIQSSGEFTLGNYLGALKNWRDMQGDFDCIFGIADLHAITVRQEPAKLRQQIYSAAAALLSVGLDPEKSIIFMQSHVAAHSQLSWILSCYTQFGELSRMTQFKDKSARHADNVNAGLFTYPVLMAADILLYMPDVVPVGADQKQHLEIARDIATRFDGIYGDVLKVPDPYIPHLGAKVMSLQDPTRKMSKSDENENARVGLLDDSDMIMRKFKRAVTDSEAIVRAGDDKPGVTNLIGIYSCITGKTVAEIEAEFDGKGYGDFKLAVGEAVVEELRPVREKYNMYISDKAQLEAIYKSGAEKAEYLAKKTLAKVMKKVGYVL